MTPGRRRKTLTERLRAIARRSDDDAHDEVRATRISIASFDRTHRDTVWIPPDPPRRWFENHEAGLESMPAPGKTHSWWRL